MARKPWSRHAPERTARGWRRETKADAGEASPAGVGSCGTCTCHVDGQAVMSCLIPVETINGATVKTLEGTTPVEGLSKLQQAFLDGFATQCGFCTSGMIGICGRSRRMRSSAFGSMLGEDGKPFRARSGESVKLADLLDDPVGPVLVRPQNVRHRPDLLAVGHVDRLVPFGDVRHLRLVEHAARRRALARCSTNTRRRPT